MPYPLASAAKSDLLEGTASLIGDWQTGTTTGTGTTTTLVDSGLSGWTDNAFQEWYALITDATATPAYQFRLADSFTGSTVTLRTALSAAPGSGKTYALLKMNPAWYMQAARIAIRKLFPWLYRPITSHYVPRSRDFEIGLPRGMDKVLRVSQDTSGTQVLQDAFDRADSSSTAGTGYTAVAGTWGISSNRLYTVTDTNGDLLISSATINLRDLLMECPMTGTLGSATDLRTPALVFRYLDSSNFLYVDLYNGTVRLVKQDGGSGSALTTATVSLTSGTYYVVRVLAVGSRVRVWVDDVELINYELTGANLKYLEGGSYGVYLLKSGSPGTAAYWRPTFYVYSRERSNTLSDLKGWKQTDGGTLNLGDNHRPTWILPSRLLTIEGAAPLTYPAADTLTGVYSGTLTNYTTAVLEVRTTDTEWQMLLAQTAAELFTIAASPMNAKTPEERALYLQESQRWSQMAQAEMAANVPAARTSVRFW